MNKDVIKKYNLQNSLNLISSKLFYISENNGVIKYSSSHFGSFTFRKLIYLFIKYSNDYKKLDISTHHLYVLANQTYLNDLNSRSTKVNDIEDLTSFTLGLSQEQFYFQERYETITSMNIRNFYIFNELFKKYSSSINCNLIIKEKLGIDLNDYNFYIYIIYAIFRKNITLDVNSNFEKKIDSNILLNAKLSSDNIKNIILYYTGTYSEYRNSKLEERLLLLKPIVKTDKNNFILLDPDSFISKLGNGVYWIIRDYFNEKKTSTFVETFGLVYENYIEELFKKKSIKNYRKLNPYEKKQTVSLADWIISTDTFEIIVEQKSTIAPDKLKHGMPNIDDIDVFINKYKKAYQQLQSTEKKELSNSNKIVLKFILHYEYLPVKEFIKERIDETLNIELPQYYIIISTSEFEILIDLLSKDEKLFNKILDEKIELETEKNYSKGTGFSQLFDKYDINNNSYLHELEKELSDKYPNFKL